MSGKLAVTRLSAIWRNASRVMAGAAVIALSATSPVQAQTTIKPFQFRIETSTGVGGTILLTNNVLRVTTNGASLDITGTNWVIGDVFPTITGAPGGVTATFVDASGNLVTDVPILMNTNNTSKTTNLIVKLVFDGTQAGGLSTLNLNLTGGVTNGYFPLTLEVGRIWNGSANAAASGAGNWSDTTKWSGGATPGAADDVVFLDAGAQTNSLLAGTTYMSNSVVDTSMTISSLRFGLTNLLGTPGTNFHNLYIKDNVNLAIKGTGGFSMLRDYTYVTTGTGTRMTVTIYGTNGTLIQTNENSNFSVLIDGQGSIPNSILDMSGLGNLKLNVSEVAVGDILAYPNYNHFITNGYTPGSTFGGSRPSKCLPNWKMALTNVVRAVYVDPNNYNNALSRSYAMEIGRNETTGGSSGNYGVSMGYSNSFAMDGLCVAGYASLGGLLNFTTSNSFAMFRNTNGGRMSVIALADAAGSSTTAALGNNTKCGNSGLGVDFTRSTVDILVDRFYMSMDRGYTTGSGVCQSSMGMSAGILDANSAFIGYQASGNQTNGNSCNASLTVSNTAVFKVNRTLAIGYTTANIGDPSLPGSTKGTITIGPGGTLMASNITVGGTTKASSGNTISMIGNATLITSNRLADASANGALGTLSLSGNNNSIKLFLNGANPSAMIYVTNLTSSGSGNKIVIGSVAGLSFPADVVIVQGAGPAISAAAFDANAIMPTGSGLTGTLGLSPSNTINLHIINRAPNNLTWRGPVGGAGTADWDYTTKNWLNTNGVLTNYDNPDIISFDGAAGYATNINVVGGVSVMTPANINMTNNSPIQYTLLDGGGQIGGTALAKYGNGTVEIDANTAAAVQLNQGALTGSVSGSIGNANVASGAVMNFSGSMSGSLAVAGTATTAGAITGTLTVQGGGVMTNAGTANSSVLVLNGGFLYNSGTLSAFGTGSPGAPTVATNATLVNNGVINGDILFVSGTFKDLGGAANMTLTSVNVGPGGTFIPGGDGIGTTTINSDGVGLFPGAALLGLPPTAVYGTTVLKVNLAASPSNTVLSVNHLSFGGSATAQTQNGCTLAINNIGAPPFAAGQTFHFFDNVAGPGAVPFNTGSSTNTYPVITPSTPGAGLKWDLRQLWVNGNIGVVGANSGPSLTNSFTMNGTNIVGQFDWDASNLGYRLQTLVTTLDTGLTATNWGSVSGSWTNTTVTLTNVIGTNCVFYRLVFP